MKPYFSLLAAYFIVLGTFGCFCFAPISGIAFPDHYDLQELVIGLVWSCIPYIPFIGILLLLGKRKLRIAATVNSRRLVQWFSVIAIGVFLWIAYLSAPGIYNMPNSVCGCAQLLPAWLAGLTFGWFLLNLGYLWITRSLPNPSVGKQAALY